MNYCIGSGIGKTKRHFLVLLIFSLLVATLPVKSPCTIIIIERVAPLVLVVVTGHGGGCQIFGIRNNRLLGEPFWKLICGIIGSFPTRYSSL